MKYQPLGNTPGSLIPKGTQENLMSNAGKTINYDLAESFKLRENVMISDLVAYFLKSPSSEKADEYWEYFSTQWRQNISNYIKHTNGSTMVKEQEIKHYKNHFKYLHGVRMIEEYVLRMREISKIKDRYPNAETEKNRTVFGLQRIVDSIHSRLMVLSKELRGNMDNPDSTMVIR